MAISQLAISQIWNFPSGQNGHMGPSAAARTGWEPSAAAIDDWEVAAWEIAHLGSCHLGKYTWELATWENAFGKVPKIA